MSHALPMQCTWWVIATYLILGSSLEIMKVMTTPTVSSKNVMHFSSEGDWNSVLLAETAREY